MSQGYRTLKKERVKSLEELQIANWYFLHGIEYEYEAPYCYDTATPEKRQYLPDFRLADYGIYHEHYGINREGRTPQYGAEAEREYLQSMQWKRKLHQEKGTVCIETYSYQFEDGTWQEHLEKELVKRGVHLHPLSDEKVDAFLNVIESNQRFASFRTFLKSFLSLYKARYRDASHFDPEFLPPCSCSHSLRTKLFLSIAKEAYLFYERQLKQEGKIDFDDMILGAAEALPSLPGFSYRYIIVDEFQDISQSRLEFLKALLKHGDAHLFAVGDDYQSIYRFAGSDLSIFTDFESYFGPSEISFITTTHRNCQELQDILVPFIQANPEQLKKNMHSSMHLPFPIRVVFSSQDKHFALKKALSHIAQADPEAHVLLLGRNHFDLDPYSTPEWKCLKDNAGKGLRILIPGFEKMEIHSCTVHASKGLEEDYVVLVNADEGTTGFPNQMEDDELLNLVLERKSSYPYDEERRLWYVALSRARKFSVVIASSDHPSVFLKEIAPSCAYLGPKPEHLDEILQDKEADGPLCPDCKSGHLVLRCYANDKKYYGCSNAPYCHYKNFDLESVERGIRCRVCGDFLVDRVNKNGHHFLGCHSYPYCTHAREYRKGESRKYRHWH